MDPLPFSSNCFGRRMIKTRYEYIGLAPRDTKVGDQVFLLKGGLTPFVLRSLDNNDEYELVGECLLHGFIGKSAGDVGDCHHISIS